MKQVGEWRLIGPEEARQLLAANYEGNRRISRGRVEHYAEMMARGAWVDYSPAPIVIDEYGRLIDGQHRLAAVIESGKSFHFLVVRASVDAYRVLDNNYKRSWAERYGLRDTPKIAEVSRLFASLMANGRFSGLVPDDAFEAVLKVYRPHAEALLQIRMPPYKVVVGSAAWLAGATYLHARVGTSVESVWEASLSNDPPPAVEAAIRAAAGRAGGGGHQELVFALAVTALSNPSRKRLGVDKDDVAAVLAQARLYTAWRAGWEIKGLGLSGLLLGFSRLRIRRKGDLVQVTVPSHEQAILDHHLPAIAKLKPRLLRLLDDREEVLAGELLDRVRELAE